MAAKVQVTMAFQGVIYPFYRTIRGRYDYENAGFTQKQVAEGSVAAMVAMTYFTLRDCARRASLPFAYSFDEFINVMEEEDLAVWGELALAEKEAAKGKKMQPQPAQVLPEQKEEAAQTN